MEEDLAVTGFHHHHYHEHNLEHNHEEVICSRFMGQSYGMFTTSEFGIFDLLDSFASYLL